MAVFSLAQAGLAVLGLLFFKITYELWKAHQFARFAKANGCEKPYNLSGQWPFSIMDGWKRLSQTINVVKNGGDILDDVFAERFEHANTVEVTQFDGSGGFDTIEPANIQALLATQFKVGETVAVDEKDLALMN